jgi:hypothetical protein
VHVNLQVSAYSTATVLTAEQQTVRAAPHPSAVSHLRTPTVQTNSQSGVLSSADASSSPQQCTMPPAPSCIAQLEDAFYAEYHSTHEPLCRAVLQLLHADLASSAWQHELEEAQHAAAARSGFQEICRRRQEKVGSKCAHHNAIVCTQYAKAHVACMHQRQPAVYPAGSSLVTLGTVHEACIASAAAACALGVQQYGRLAVHHGVAARES